MTKVQRPERRLAAVFVADVVAYSRVMGQDEVGTLAALSDHRVRFDAAAAEHDGRVVNSTGDSILAEFKSAAAAVQCAWSIQETITEANRGIADYKRIQFRIGVHVGDVLVRGNDLFGDSINIAARLQAMAEPGGIYISDAVHEHVRKSVDFTFVALGPQNAKNIAEPLSAFSVLPALSGGKPLRESDRASRRPSLAVLPFRNLSDDHADEYLADGITDDTIIALVKTRWIYVTPRNSAFSLKGKDLNVVEAARSLGVGYVLSGSVRRAGSHVRVTIELVEASSGEAIWADRYDRDFTDIFVLQDEIVEAVIGAMEPELLKHEGRSGAARPQSVSAWDLVRRGMWEFHKFTRESHKQARQLFGRAVELDPEAPEGHIWLARSMAGPVWYGWTEDAPSAARLGVLEALASVRLDDKNPYAHYAMAVTHIVSSKLETAARSARYALDLSPYFALGHLVLGCVHLHQGDPKRAIEPLKHGIRLSPFDGQGFSWWTFLAIAHFFGGDAENGLEAVKQALMVRPHWVPALRVYALCALALDRHAEARSALVDVQVSHDSDLDTMPLLLKHNPKWDEIFRDASVT
jgi:adenylate cyclase